MNESENTPQGAQENKPTIYLVAIPVIEELPEAGFYTVNPEEMARSLRAIGKLAYALLSSGMDADSVMARMMGVE